MARRAGWITRLRGHLDLDNRICYTCEAEMRETRQCTARGFNGMGAASGAKGGITMNIPIPPEDFSLLLNEINLSDIFIGREQQLDQFRFYLERWQRLATTAP